MCKIIVIEDSNLMRMRITKVLQKNGYNDVIGFSSADAIGSNPKLFLNNVDLIITDIWLQGMSGIELIRILNNYPLYCNIPIIVVSSSNDIKTINEAIKAGAVDYVIKPFEEKLLMEKVKKIIGKPREDTKDQVSFNVEEIKMIISMEYERATRGKQPLSFIKLKVNKGDIQNCITQIKSKIRKIDTVCDLEQSIIVILPLTDEKGSNVVLSKINDQLLRFSIEILKKDLLTLDPDSSQSVDDLLGKLL